MTREEAIKFLALIKVAYPTAYKDMDKENKLATVNMWQSTFPQIPLRIMEFAFDHFRRVSKFPPTVAEMYEELRHVYYRALQDSLTNEGCKEIEDRAEWIMAYTSQFRGNNTPCQINYTSIQREELVLPEAKPQMALPQRELSWEDA
jgi:hypothetical protein